MKKVIALIFSAAIIISILNISAYAVDLSEAEDSGWHDSGETITRMTSQEYYAAQSDLIAKFCDGKITYSEFQDQSQAVTDEFVTSNTVGGVINDGVLTACNTIAALSEKFAYTMGKYGDSALDYISDYVSDFINEYSVLSDKPTTDLMGGGAKIVITYPNGSSRIYTCSYATVGIPDDRGRRHIIIYSGDGQSYRYDLQNDGTYKLMWQSGNSSSSPVGDPVFTDYGAVDLSGNIYKFYGDIRTLEGESFPTDDEYELVKDYDFSELTETELADLINDMTEEFERQDPDLSTIEGLLRAIYARMGKLDSDNDNDLLSQIDASIQSLKAAITSLFSNEDKKDDNIENDNSTVTEEHEIAGTLYNVIPLEKNWLQKITHDKTNLHVEYQGKQYYLESDGTLLLDGKYYNVDMNYSSTLDEILYTLFDIRDSLELLTEEEKQMSFDDFFDLKVSDFKLDLDEKFAFKDNLKDFIQNFLNEFNSSVPVYESGD